MSIYPKFSGSITCRNCAPQLWSPTLRKQLLKTEEEAIENKNSAHWLAIALLLKVICNQLFKLSGNFTATKD